MSTVKVVFRSSNGTFTVPSGVSSVQIECVGAGGGADRWAGGGGGAYSRVDSYPVSPGMVLTCQVGASVLNTQGTRRDGGPTAVLVGSTVICRAMGGTGAQFPTNGIGGIAVDGLGDLRTSGGGGGTSSTNNFPDGGGGGGGAGGPNGSGQRGQNASGSTAGLGGLVGGAISTSGNGGRGRGITPGTTTTANATNGTFPGGGGGSGGTASTPPTNGIGGGGLVKFTYTQVDVSSFGLNLGF